MEGRGRETGSAARTCSMLSRQQEADLASYNNTDHASGSADKLRQLGREALELSGGREAGKGEFLSDMGPSGSILVTHQPLSRSIDFVSCRRLGLGMDLSKIASEEIRWSVE